MDASEVPVLMPPLVLSGGVIPLASVVGVSIPVDGVGVTIMVSVLFTVVLSVVELVQEAVNSARAATGSRIFFMIGKKLNTYIRKKSFLKA
jgi:hypothetical protein